MYFETQLSQVIEIDLYLVISFFNFFWYKVTFLVQKNHVRTVPVCFSCTTEVYSDLKL